MKKFIFLTVIMTFGLLHSVDATITAVFDDLTKWTDLTEEEEALITKLSKTEQCILARETSRKWTVEYRTDESYPQAIFFIQKLIGHEAVDIINLADKPSPLRQKNLERTLQRFSTYDHFFANLSYFKSFAQAVVVINSLRMADKMLDFIKTEGKKRDNFNSWFQNIFIPSNVCDLMIYQAALEMPSPKLSVPTTLELEAPKQ